MIFYNIKNRAFTLVELLITITILAILATIAFLSFGNYAGDARDSVRISDLKNIQKSFELKLGKGSLLPEPDEKSTIGVSLDETPGILWYEGKFGEEVLKEMKEFSELPLDPSDKSKYKYLVTEDREHYYLEANLESGEKIVVTNYKNTFSQNNSGNNSGGSSPGDSVPTCDNPIYLHSNGVTIKAKECAEAGQEYSFNGTNYYVASDKNDIKNKINSGYSANRIVTSKVTDMSELFQYNNSFNEDIGNWDTSSVTNMSNMFHTAIDFNKDINDWDVSLVGNMSGMFMQAVNFNQPLNKWNIDSVYDMKDMFNHAASFNQDITSWDVSRVIYLSQMFDGATYFYQNISGWITRGGNYCFRIAPHLPDSYIPSGCPSF
ncbi:hypothetical protein DLH72_00780 [Candidatus Gracilibacteria bacterium]|nr:MAG: hypothetical protein DLH72_00780 [Candidatus Gracilibacteria bacterium]